jgi:large subunit ribosomal protein L27
LVEAKIWRPTRRRPAATAATRAAAGREAFRGEAVSGGTIIIRQHGTKWKPGKNVGLAKDHSLFALIDGVVRFEDHGGRGLRISVLPPS